VDGREGEVLLALASREAVELVIWGREGKATAVEAKLVKGPVLEVRYWAAEVL
jgi:hypothetical protein